jgi:hypothetical protein
MIGCGLRINYHSKPRADGAKRRARVLTPGETGYLHPGKRGTYTRLFTPGETKALAKSKVHQWSRAWLTNDVSVGGHPHWSQNMWQTVMNREHWLVQFKVYIITTAWRQRNSKHFLIWWLINFLQIYFLFARIFARFCKFQKLSQK